MTVGILVWFLSLPFSRAEMVHASSLLVQIISLFALALGLKFMWCGVEKEKAETSLYLGSTTAHPLPAGLLWRQCTNLPAACAED